MHAYIRVQFFVCYLYVFVAVTVRLLAAVALIFYICRQCATKLNEQQLIVPVCIIL